MLQICQLRKCNETMRIIGHGPFDRRRIERFPILQGIRLPWEPLRGRTGETLRIQETVRPYFENRGFRLPRCWQHRGVPGALLEFPVPLPFLRLWRHRWHGMPPQPSLQSHPFGYPGEGLYKRSFWLCNYSCDILIFSFFSFRKKWNIIRNLSYSSLDLVFTTRK